MKWILIVLLVVLGCSAKACDGYTRYETVCVCAAHYEQVWVNAPIHSHCGLLVRSGYYASVYVPPRYATRAVWVEYAPVYSGPVGGSPNYLTYGYRRW